jgi:hypothetical protein
MGRRYFIKSIFQVQKIDFLNFNANHLKDQAFGPSRQVVADNLALVHFDLGLWLQPSNIPGGSERVQNSYRHSISSKQGGEFNHIAS